MAAGTPNQAWTRRRMAAQAYQPKRTRLLLVAEAPPDDENRYFYFEDVKTADSLFEEVCGVLFEEKPEHDKAPYLKVLRRRGVFLVDLKPDAPRTGEALAPYVAPLLINVQTLAPGKIILIKADVYKAAFEPMKKAGLPVVDVRIPFPSAGHEIEFRREFTKALVRGGLENLIRPLPPSAESAEQ